jgi:hypothetical protein
MRQEDERDGESEAFSFEKDARGKEQQLKALSYLDLFGWQLCRRLFFRVEASATWRPKKHGRTPEQERARRRSGLRLTEDAYTTMKSQQNMVHGQSSLRCNERSFRLRIR